MANPEHLKILEQGVEAWNEWREEDSPTVPDLSGADLTGANLRYTDFSKTDFRMVDLSGADLVGAILNEANLAGAFLGEANLGEADLSRANLAGAFLGEAYLGEAELTLTNLSLTNLPGANLTGASLYETTFGDTNLAGAIGLETCIHYGPSFIDHRTLQNNWPLPEAFLRGCGLPDRLIEYLPSLMDDPIQFYSCFISYSSKDDEFAKRLYADLQAEGVRCWFAPEDLKIGDKFRAHIDDAIRFHEKLLLVLSEDAIASDWVEKEVETAFEKERKTKKTVLFPVRLDETVMDSDTAWAADIRRTRHIGDFQDWKDHEAYRKTFKRLLRDLKAQKK